MSIRWVETRSILKRPKTVLAVSFDGSMSFRMVRRLNGLPPRSRGRRSCNAA